MPRGAARLEGPLEEHLLILWLWQTVRPQIPLKFDMREEIRLSYRFVFNYELTEDQIDQWLRLEENMRSFGYGRFKLSSPLSAVLNQ